MIVLIFDTETTGLPPKNCEVSLYNMDIWPYIVQFSYVLYDNVTHRVLKIMDHIIQLPNNIIMTEENVNIHGISNETMREKGVNLTTFLDDFMLDFIDADRIVAHNIHFDLNMLKVEILRKITYDLNYFHAEQYNSYLQIINNCNKYVCTMQETIDLCGIERNNKKGNYMKFPKLSELHNKLYNIVPKNLHNSLNDVFICLRCYCQIHNKVDILEKNVELNYIFKNLL